jgi:hypothetical protein
MIFWRTMAVSQMSTAKTTFTHDPLPFGAMAHPDEDEAAGEPLPAAPSLELSPSDVAVGLLGIAVVAFMVYTLTRTAK